MESYIAEWLQVILRWFHVVAAITWVGSSFYFNRIDRSFEAPEPPMDWVSGQLWSIHGGSIYSYNRYPLGPGFIPRRLKWSKWESVGTWFSGALLLALIYWYGATLNLVSHTHGLVGPTGAIAISIGSIVGGWLIYDALCRMIHNDTLLFIILAVLFSLSVPAFFQVFSGKAAYLHVGAVMGTIMAANVWFVILPGQKRMLRAIEDGTIKDFDVGTQAKKRNIHANYFTLPVIFAMLAAHLPMAYGHDLGWLAFILISAAGVAVRHFFNTMHAGTARPSFLALGAALAIGTMVLIAPRQSAEMPLNNAITYRDIAPIIDRHCTVCHAAKPRHEAFAAPPKGLVLDQREDVIRAAPLIHQQAVLSRAMPPGNVTGMTEEERSLLAMWVVGGAKENRDE